MSSKSFEYFKPATVAEAINMMKEQGSDAHILAGGTDLAVEVKEDLTTPEALIDIKGIESLQGMEFDGKTLYLGAAITFSDLIRSDIIREHFPMLAEASMTVASMGLRNRATIVGNICSGVPCMDSAPALLVYEASVFIEGPGGSREVSILEFFRGPRKTALKPNEIVVGLRFTQPSGRYAGCYVKLQRTRGEDLAQAGVAVLALENNTYRVAFTAVGPVPTRGRIIEDALNGNPLTPDLLAKARELVSEEISPITDIRSTKTYRLHVTGVMLERGLKASVSRLKGEGPPFGTSLM